MPTVAFGAMPPPQPSGNIGGVAPQQPMPIVLPDTGAKAPNPPAPKIRSEFPETWLWLDSATECVNFIFSNFGDVTNLNN